MGKIKGKFIENSTITEQQLSSSVNTSLDKADNAVQKTGNETIGGIKTFSSFPLTPSSAPTADYQVANKKYIDDNSSGISYSVVNGSITMEAKKGYIAYAAWDISTASYDSKSFSVSSKDVTPISLFFKPDGSKMFFLGAVNDTIFQYSLSTPWDINTASYDSKSFSVSSQDTSHRDIFFKPDGSKIFVMGSTNRKIFQYSLSIAWDISTASYDSKSYYVGSLDTFPEGLFFKPDGSKMFIMGLNNTRVLQCSLSTPWDVSTASYDGKSFNVTSQETSPRDIFFKPDGSKIFVMGYNTDTIYQYSLSIAWDISTASYDSKSFSVGSQDSTPMGLFLKYDGSKVYMIGNITDTIYQYSLSIPELLLPSSANIGDEIKIYSKDAIKITQNANNKIISGSEETITGTSGYFEVGSNKSVGLIYLGDNVWGVTEQQLSSSVNASLDKADNAVQKTGNETIGGIKTFSSFPLTPSSVPTTEYQIVNKKYVDDNMSTIYNLDGGYASSSFGGLTINVINGGGA